VGCQVFAVYFFLNVVRTNVYQTVISLIIGVYSRNRPDCIHIHSDSDVSCQDVRCL